MTSNIRAMAINKVEKKLGEQKGKLRIARLISDNMDQIDEKDLYSKSEAILEILRLRREADILGKQAELLKKLGDYGIED
jgi:hypothetical protein